MHPGMACCAIVYQKEDVIHDRVLFESKGRGD